MRKLLVAVGALAAMLGCASPARALPGGPFGWSGLTWCPTYQGWSCTDTETSAQYTVSFAPAQDSISHGALVMTLDGSVSGAVNTASYEDPGPGSTVTAVITLACDSSGQIENWPALWLAGTTGTWPANGEIDVMEGLGGQAAWHYHYADAPGQLATVGGTVPGDWCGRHRYSVTWDATQVSIYYDGTLAGQVTAAQIGQPVATDPMCILLGNEQGQWGGPDVSPARMAVSSVTVS